MPSEAAATSLATAPGQTPGPYGAYAAAPSTALHNSTPGTVFQRYVPYDPHTNSAAPVPTNMHTAYPHQPYAAVYAVPAASDVYAVPTPTTPVQTNLTSRLLGNKAVPGDITSVNVFNPATDTTVIVNASSSSSSVL